jgi:hypothetical protein
MCAEDGQTAISVSYATETWRPPGISSLSTLSPNIGCSMARLRFDGTNQMGMSLQHKRGMADHECKCKGGTTKGYQVVVHPDRAGNLEGAQPENFS